MTKLQKTDLPDDAPNTFENATIQQPPQTEDIEFKIPPKKSLTKSMTFGHKGSGGGNQASLDPKDAAKIAWKSTLKKSATLSKQRSIRI